MLLKCLRFWLHLCSRQFFFDLFNLMCGLLMKSRVIIIGAGFGGITAAKQLCATDCEITIIDKTNHHLFQPLLYQVATAGLSPADIAMPIRAIFSGHSNVHVIMDEVLFIDKINATVNLKDITLSYDYLICAPGARHTYFGKDQWAAYAPGLKTLSDALTIREKMLSAFEHAENETNPEAKRAYLTFVVIGGGPTGVEMAGAIAEIAKQILEKDFNTIDPKDVRVFLVEAGERLLPAFTNKLSAYTVKTLHSMGVTVLLKTVAENINEDGVQLNKEFFSSKNVIWAAGNLASPLLKTLDTPLDRVGRAVVNPDLSLPGSPNIFVIGDAAVSVQKNGDPVPGVAPAAMQQGRYVGKLIANRALPVEQRKPFAYLDKGSLATIGRAKAVAQLWGLQFTGFFA
jgi:NADH dehydrogenase